MIHNHIVRFRGSGVRRGTSQYGPFLRIVLDTLVDGCQQATRMLVEGRSSAPGTAPSWLETAAGFEVLELRDGELRLRTQSLSELLTVEAWNVRASFLHGTSGLGLLEDGLEHAISGDANSDFYDRKLIETLESFGRLLQYDIEAIELINGRSLRIDETAVRSIRELRSRFPEDKRISLGAVVEQISRDGRRFVIVLDSGERAAVVAVSNEAATRLNMGLIGARVVVTGVARYKPSGRILRIDAERVWDSDDINADLQRMVEQGALREARALIQEEIAQGRGEGVATWAKLLALPIVTPGEAASGRQDLDANQQWLHAHQAEFAGSWVALRNGDRLDSDRSFKVLQQRLRARGDVGVLVTKCGGARGGRSGS